jgi:hypothetical protein
LKERKIEENFRGDCQIGSDLRGGRNRCNADPAINTNDVKKAFASDWMCLSERSSSMEDIESRVGRHFIEKAQEITKREDIPMLRQSLRGNQFPVFTSCLLSFPIVSQ